MRTTFAVLLTLGAAGAQLPPATTGDLLVSSSSNDRLLRLAFDGTELGAISLQGLRHPRGIVVGRNGDVLVVSQNSHEVLVLDRTLRLVRRFPTKSVRSPTGAAFGPNGNLYVAGFSSNNVGEYKVDGTFVRTYTTSGLGGANCVAFHPAGGFLIASAFNGRVYHLAANGNLVRSFTGFGLSSPMGIAIWKNEVFVAGGGSNNVVVFDLAGKPLRQIRHADISGPQGIAFTADGRFAVSGYYNDKVSWFKPDGTHLRSVKPGQSKIPRSLAWLPGVSLEYSGKPVLGVPFPLRVSSPHEPRLAYATALALSKSPGLVLPDTRVLDLTPDALFFLSLTFPSFVGALDAQGTARFTLTLPKIDTLKGLQIHAAALTLDPSHKTLFRQLSTSATWTL